MLPLVDKSNTVETRRGVSFQHPEILAHAEQVTSTLSEPYYWRLPEQFRGSMVGKTCYDSLFVLFCHIYVCFVQHVTIYNPIKHSCKISTAMVISSINSSSTSVFRSQHMVGS